MRPEWVAGDKFLFLEWRMWWSFRWQNLSFFSWENWQKICHILALSRPLNRLNAILSLLERLGEDAPRVSCRWQVSFLGVKNVVKFSVTKFKPISPGEFWQKIATKKSPHLSLPKFQNFITLNFWDRSRVKKANIEIFSTTPALSRPPSTGWMLYYLCFSPSTAIGPALR